MLGVAVVRVAVVRVAVVRVAVMLLCKHASRAVLRVLGRVGGE